MTAYCYRHANTETGLRCGSCDRPICVKCVVQHPVGIRCQECARVRKIPVLDVTPSYYARAVATAVGVGVVFVLLVVGLSLLPLGFLAFPLRMLVLVGFGYVMGSAVSQAVNKKRGRGLQWVAGASVVVAAILVAPWLGLGVGFYGLALLGIATYLAVRQLRI